MLRTEVPTRNQPVTQRLVLCQASWLARPVTSLGGEGLPCSSIARRKGAHHSLHPQLVLPGIIGQALVKLIKTIVSSIYYYYRNLNIKYQRCLLEEEQIAREFAFFFWMHQISTLTSKWLITFRVDRRRDAAPFVPGNSWAKNAGGGQSSSYAPSDEIEEVKEESLTRLK